MKDKYILDAVSKKANFVSISLHLFVDVNSYQFSGETIHAPENAGTGLAHVVCKRVSDTKKKHYWLLYVIMSGRYILCT